jgi:hypothetical protein
VLPAVAGTASRESAPLCRRTRVRTKCWLLLPDRTVTDTNEYCSQSTQHYIEEESSLNVSTKRLVIVRPVTDVLFEGFNRSILVSGEPDVKNSPHGFLKRLGIYFFNKFIPKVITRHKELQRTDIDTSVMNTE